jgi:glycerol transport system ATP-binding protein
VIYDTMTVYENLAFPLRNRGVDARTIATRVGEVAEMLELTPELHRRARSLSADVKQKTSLGRGLVRPDVAAILFDEPLTVIDPHLKWQLRRKLKEIHQRLRLTLVYVTHDQKEALTFAEQVAVMQDGRVLQVGTPQELFEAPAHRFVGFFIGSPGMNFLRCELDGNVAIVEGQRIPLDPAVATRARNEQGPYEIGIRPEFISLGGGEGGLAATVRWVEDLGSYRIVSAVIGDQPVKIKVADGLPIPEGRCAVHFAEAGTRLYAGERLVG